MRALLLALPLFVTLFASSVCAGILEPNENLMVDGIPPISDDIVGKVRQYGAFSSASMVAWRPGGGGMLVRARQGSTSQLFMLERAGGKLEPLTDFPDAVSGGNFQPGKGEYLLFEKASGGDEVYRLYCLDMDSRKVTPVSIEGERMSSLSWSRKGDRILYSTSTVDRNAQRGDEGDGEGDGAERKSARTLWLADPLHPETAQKLMSFEDSRFSGFRFFPDEKSLLMQEYVSANESYLWALDLKSGEKRRITPEKSANGEPVFYAGARFSRDGTKLYAISDRDNEYRQLVSIELATGKETPLAPQLKFDVSEFSISDKANRIALITNEAGASALRMLELDTLKELPRPALLPGVISGLHWGLDQSGKDDGKVLAFNLVSARSPGAAFAMNIENGKLTRWTTATMRGVSAYELAEPKLVRWKSFDGREISGFLYAPDAKDFPGKRPVLISIHGGPEGQARPGFQGRLNYLINGLGIAIIEPNVRGSSGFGKTFLALDNGKKREDSVKDIGALLDWIQTQDNLDASRVLVRGGSYGGYMSLAVSVMYADRIAGAIDLVGPSHFVTFLTHTESYRRDLRRAEYGDERDPEMRAFFEKISPLNNAGKIKKPMFIVPGKHDPRVPYTEAVQMVEKLKQQKTPVWFLLAKDEGHGFAKRANQDYLFYAEMRFLEETLLKTPAEKSAAK